MKFTQRMLFTSLLYYNLGTRFTVRRGQYNVNSGFNNCLWSLATDQERESLLF